MKNHYIRLAEIVQEGVDEEFVEIFRDPERRLDYDFVLPLLAEIRTAHENKALALWKEQGCVSRELRRESALADICAFFAACLTGRAGEFRATAEEAMETAGYPGEKEMVRILSE